MPLGAVSNLLNKFIVRLLTVPLGVPLSAECIPAMASSALPLYDAEDPHGGKFAGRLRVFNRKSASVDPAALATLQQPCCQQQVGQDCPEPRMHISACLATCIHACNLLRYQTDMPRVNAVQYRVYWMAGLTKRPTHQHPAHLESSTVRIGSDLRIIQHGWLFCVPFCHCL